MHNAQEGIATEPEDSQCALSGREAAMAASEQLQLGPEVFSLLYAPRSQAQQLWKVQCLVQEADPSSAAKAGRAPALACAQEGDGQPPQLLAGALVLVQTDGGQSKLRQVVRASRTALSHAMEQQQQQQQQELSPQCELHLQVSCPNQGWSCRARGMLCTTCSQSFGSLWTSPKHAHNS